MADELAGGVAGVRLGEADTSTHLQRSAVYVDIAAADPQRLEVLTLISIEEKPTPAGSWVWTAAAAKSSSVHSNLQHVEQPSRHRKVVGPAAVSSEAGFVRLGLADGWLSASAGLAACRARCVAGDPSPGQRLRPGPAARRVRSRSAVNPAIRQFGATFGVALTVALLGTVTPLDALDHFQRVWWMLLACGVLTSAAALALPRPATPKQPVLAHATVGTEA